MPFAVFGRLAFLVTFGDGLGVLMAGYGRVRQVLALVLLAAGVGVPVAAGPVPAAATAATAVQASALAAATGQPVEVMADRTDWSQTFAEPGGGFEATESLMPRRVREPDGSWVPVDTTLSVQPDGSVSPGAITTGLTLSDGGSGPLYTLAENGQSLSVSWPYGSLPVPALSGATATYPNVLPGVNLLVSATPTGVSDVIEVTSVSAAANPDLRRITFPQTTTGLSVSADAQGALTAADSGGNPVFTAPPPQMWDSAGSAPAGPIGARRAASAPVPSAGTVPAGAAGPVPGDADGVMGVSAAAGSVSLTPVASVLSGAAVVYPVFIDPSWDVTKAGAATWAEATETGAGGGSGNWMYSSPLGGVRSGVACDTSTDPNCPNESHVNNPEYVTLWSFLNFPVPAAFAQSSPDFVDAQLQINETWAWSCSPSDLVMQQTGYAGPSTQWTPSGSDMPSEMAVLDTDNTAAGWSPSGTPGGGGTGSCDEKQVNLNATTALEAAGDPGYSIVDLSGKPDVTLELRANASDESNWVLNSWKRFAGDSVDLVIYWRHKPIVTGDTDTRDLFNGGSGGTRSHCATDPTQPDNVSTNAPGWQATISDPDVLFDSQNSTNEPLDGEFSWLNYTEYQANHNSYAHGVIGDPDNPQSPGHLFTASRSGTPGDEYGWAAYGQTLSVADGITPRGTSTEDMAPVLTGDAAAECYFQIDSTPPSGTVGVSSNVYSNDSSSGSVGKPGDFTFTDPGFSDPECAGSASLCDAPVGYRYSFGSSTMTGYVHATNGTATVTFTPYTPQQLGLFVEAVDAAGNVGPLVTKSGQTVANFTLIPGTPPTNNPITLAYWALNNWADEHGNGADLTAQSGAELSCQGSGGQNPPGFLCTLVGEGDTSRPVLAADGAFSVSLWADPAESMFCLVGCTAMSEDGNNVGVFTLTWMELPNSQFQPSGEGYWLFSMYAGDNANATLYQARSPIVRDGLWAQLTAVFNPGQIVAVGQTGALDLYVDGSTQPIVTYDPVEWSSAPGGVLRIGAGFQGANPFQGNLSDACAFYGALSQQDVTDLFDYNSATQSNGDGCAAVATQYKWPN